MTKASSLWDMTPCCSLFFNILKDDNAFIFRVTHKEYFDCLTLKMELLSLSQCQQLHTQQHSNYTPNNTATHPRRPEFSLTLQSTCLNDICMCVQETEKGIFWNPINDRYKCVVASPKKESKLKGLKSFIAYQLTPTVSIFNIAQSCYILSHLSFCHCCALFVGGRLSVPCYVIHEPIGSGAG